MVPANADEKDIGETFLTQLVSNFNDLFFVGETAFCALYHFRRIVL